MSEESRKLYGGKKIFFLYPNNSIQNQIIDELIQNEYEAYVFKDHAKLLKLLNKYPDSIVYANVDSGMNAMEWDRYLGAFETVAPDVKIGVFSSNTDDEVRAKFTGKLRATLGYIILKHDMSKTAGTILEVLHALNVKGRRKYLRANIDPRDTHASVNMPFNGDFIKGTIKDISVVGFACILENDPGFQKNELVKDIQIKLQSMILKAEAVVFGSRKEYEQKMYVFIFTQRIDPEVRIKIRKYIQVNLQTAIENEKVK